MTNLFVVFVAAFLLPLIFHSWRVAVLALGVQGFLLGLILLATHEMSPATMIEASNLFFVRAIVVPWILLRCMGRYKMESDFSLIKKSAGQWTFALIIVVLGTVFGRMMAPEDPLESFQVGTAAIAILTSFLILANQQHMIGQIVGVITFEGGLTLVELLSPHAMPLPVYLGISTVFLCLLFTFADYVTKMKSTVSTDDTFEDGIVL